MLKNLKKNYFLLISTFLILYFFFNLITGERGLISYLEKKKILKNLKMKKTNLTKTKYTHKLKRSTTNHMSKKQLNTTK